MNTVAGKINDLQAILAHGATWLGWREKPGDSFWYTDTEPHLKALHWLLTGNGMLLAFEKMRTEKEGVRRRFADELHKQLPLWKFDNAPRWIPKLDELTPELVWRAVVEATK